tara:strand:- start:127 stop:447 length:321 start_codon:yes stop_codon:yes gene_type:complete
MPDNTGVNRNKNGTFKQGVSGNPKGRPKGSVAPSDILRQIASEFVNDESERTKLDFIMRMLFKMASNGNLQAIKEIIDRLEGKSTEKFADVTEEWKELLFALNKPE